MKRKATPAPEPDTPSPALLAALPKGARQVPWDWDELVKEPDEPYVADPCSRLLGVLQRAMAVVHLASRTPPHHKRRAVAQTIAFHAHCTMGMARADAMRNSRSEGEVIAVERVLGRAIEAFRKWSQILAVVDPARDPIWAERYTELDRSMFDIIPFQRPAAGSCETLEEAEEALRAQGYDETTAAEAFAWARRNLPRAADRPFGQASWKTGRRPASLSEFKAQHVSKVREAMKVHTKPDAIARACRGVKRQTALDIARILRNK